MDTPTNPTDLIITNLPITDPRCVRAAERCTAFYAAENASQEVVSWASQFEYGHWLLYYYLALLAFLFLWRVVRVYHDRTASRSSREVSEAGSRATPSVVAKIQACGRFVFYRRSTILRGSLALPSYGIIAILLLALLFLALLVFTQKPYYRQHLGYGSPPIAIRSGLMAIACLPILVALAGKVNLVTMVIGISHERLNVFHRWIAWFTFILSLIHAIPFFVASYQDEGFGGLERVNKEFFAAMTGAGEFTGVITFGTLFGLCVLSLPWVRRTAYELFCAVHIALAIAFIGLLFWHTSYQGTSALDSWTYLYATCAVWIISWVGRLFWKIQAFNLKNDWFAACDVSVQECPGDVTRVEVRPLHNFHWKPGQHVYLRFVEIAPLENHPFTIASIAASEQSLMERTTTGLTRPLVFLVRSHKGFTRKLLDRARGPRAHVQTKVWIDGSYGGVSRPLMFIHDHIVLVAAGTGITACLPFLLQFVDLRRRDVTIRTRRLTFVWIVKNATVVSWVLEELKDALGKPQEGTNIGARFIVTRPEEPEIVEKVVVESKPKYPEISQTPVTARYTAYRACIEAMAGLGEVSYGRPDLSAIIKDASQASEKTYILACGPRKFSTDISNAVAQAQRRVLTGECLEIALHVESFGW